VNIQCIVSQRSTALDVKLADVCTANSKQRTIEDKNLA